MKVFYFLFLILLIINNVQSRSEEYYECINPNKIISSPINCTSVSIPASDGYKCCSFEITLENKTSYNCFTVETKYTKDQKSLDEYASKINLAFFFASSGGQMKIDCGSSLTSKKNYKEYSDDYLNCYDSNLLGAENESECFKYEIPMDEQNKCCFIEISKLDKNGNFSNDKRCYLINNIYFSEKNLTDYLLDESKLDNLIYVKDTNVTIHCKNLEAYYFTGNLDYGKKPSSPKEDNKEKSGMELWKIIIIIFVCLLVVVFCIFCCIKKRKTATNSSSKLLSNKIEMDRR